MNAPFLPQAAWRSDLMCYVNRIDYDAAKKTGRVRMPDGSCTDMGGAIRLFEGIDPGVRAIRTYSGDDLDTCYFLIDGEWEALFPAEVEAMFPEDAPSDFRVLAAVRQPEPRAAPSAPEQSLTPGMA